MLKKIGLPAIALLACWHSPRIRQRRREIRRSRRSANLHLSSVPAHPPAVVVRLRLPFTAGLRGRLWVVVASTAIGPATLCGSMAIETTAAVIYSGDSGQRRALRRTLGRLRPGAWTPPQRMALPT